MTASTWDQRYRDGSDRWELGKPAPPLDAFLRADLGYEAIGLDFSSEAIQRAEALHGADRDRLRWRQADLFDGAALAAAGFHQQLWEPAQGSARERDNEWLGLWRR